MQNQKKEQIYSVAEKLRLIDEYLSGKIIKKQFCDNYKISRSTIHNWKKQLNTQNKTGINSANRTNKSKRHGYSDVKKAEFVKLYHLSLMPIQEFCDDNKISYHSLRRWITKFRTDKIPGKFIELNGANTDSFANVTIDDQAHQTYQAYTTNQAKANLVNPVNSERPCLKDNISGIKIILPNNIILVIANGFNKQTLKYAIEVISTC